MIVDPFVERLSGIAFRSGEMTWGCISSTRMGVQMTCHRATRKQEVLLYNCQQSPSAFLNVKSGQLQG
jgi:hypothetical protein